MSNTVFGPAELMKYMGMGDAASIQRGNAQLKADIQSATGGSPAVPGAAAPAGMPAMPGQGMVAPLAAQGPLAQALAQRQMAAQPQGVMGSGGVMGLPPMTQR